MIVGHGKIAERVTIYSLCVLWSSFDTLTKLSAPLNETVRPSCFSSYILTKIFCYFHSYFHLIRNKGKFLYRNK